jgi:hypothetical protein
MPSREQRRHNPDLGKWLHIEDADGNPYDIYLRDISGKDEYEFTQMMPNAGGLCDLFFEGRVSLVNIAGLIWAFRRKNGERNLKIPDVLKTVNLMSIETMELHDPDDEDDDASPAPDDPHAKLAKIEAERAAGLAGFGGGSDPSDPGSGPSTE